MASTDDNTYNWTCPHCDWRNEGTARTDVICEGCGREFDRAPGTRSSISESPVRIDLDQPFTVDDVRKLIASVEDDRAWTLVINYAGQAYLLDFHANREKLGLGESAEPFDSSPEATMKYWKEHIERDNRLLAAKSNEVYLRFETYGMGNGYVGRVCGA
jgi:hypothetical protein